MPAPSDPGFLVLHALRLKGFADTATIAALSRLELAEAVRFLDKASAAGHVTERRGRLAGWALTPAGRDRHRRLVADERDAAGAGPVVAEAYRRFLSVNGELLEVCTDWQLRGDTTNDHSDGDHDRAVVARLGAVAEVAGPVCTMLAGALGRFASYGPRLALALERVRAGDGDWFTKPTIDSFHTVWFELHEDLLVTLGIERSKEGSPS